MPEDVVPTEFAEGVETSLCGVAVGLHPSPATVITPSQSASWRRLGFVLLMGSSLGCASAGAQTAPGKSSSHRPDADEAPAGGRRPGETVDPWFAEIRRLPAGAVVPSGASSHGVAPLDLEVRISPPASSAFAEWSAASVPLPDGTLIAALHSEAGAPRDVFAMRRTGSEWAFRAFDERGVAVPTDDLLCARCHADAPSDLVFGPRRPQPSAVSGHKM